MSEPIPDDDYREMAALLDRAVAEHRARRGEGDPAAEPFGDLAIRLRDEGQVIPGMLAAQCATAIRTGHANDLLGTFFYTLADEPDADFSEN